MQTKNINHDYRSHQEIQQHHHHPSCAAFRQATTVPVGNSIISISSHPNTCLGNTISATNTTTNTCHHHHHHPKTTTTAASVAAISSDDSIAAATTSTETVLQVPTRTTHQQQQHNLGHCSSLRPTNTTTTSTIISCNSNKSSSSSRNTCSEQQVAVASRPMTGSQAALISPLDSKTVAVVERSSAPVAQVPQSRTFPRRDEDGSEIVLFEDECYLGQEDLDCQLPSSSSTRVLQQNTVNMSVIQQQQLLQQRRNPVIGLSGSQPSLSGTLAAFVTGSNGSHQHFNHNHGHQHNQQQPSGHQHNRPSCSHSPAASQQSMLLTSTSFSSSAAVAANSKTPPHQQTNTAASASAAATASLQQSSRFLTTTTATAATTTSDVAGQRRRCSSPQLPTTTTATTGRSTTFFSGSSTLPPNSTLSSLLAKGAGSFAANLGHSSHFEHQSNQSCSGDKLMKTMQQHQQQQQLSTTAEAAAPLRRQASMSHLEKVAETKSKANLLHKGEAKLGSFQRLKAMLSSPKAEHKSLKALSNGTSSSSSSTTTTTNSSPANTTSTYRPGEEIVLPPESSVDRHQRINGAGVVSGDVFGVRFSGGNAAVLANRPLSTLNKYTVSASSTNLSSSSSTSTTHLNHSHHHHNYHPHHPQQQQQQQQATTTFSPNSTAETSFDEAGEDQSSFHLRNVCNKLFSQKQYSALHSSSVGNLQLQLQQLTASPDSAGGVLSSVVQKVTSDQSLLAYRNITPDESGVEKVSQKEAIYTAYGNRPTASTSTNITSSPSSHLLTSSASFQHQLNAVPESSMEYHHNHHTHFNPNHQQYSSVNSHYHHQHHDNQRNHVLQQQQQQQQQQSPGGQHNEHVVVVSELSPKATPPSANGLTVRSQTPVGQQQQQQQQQTSSKPIVIAEHHRTVNGSTLSLNVASLGESAGGGDSVASHGDHESSESGRGTMNSHLEERVGGGGGGHNSSASLNGHPMMNSPADLTSLDSDQSGENHHNHGHSHHHHHHQQEAVSAGNGGVTRRPEPVLSKSGRNGSSSNYSTIQRYLDEQQRQQKASSAKQEAEALCKDFQSSKLSLNDVTDDDSWTSISDSEPSTMKKRPTNGLLLPTKSTKKGQILATMAAAKGASRLLQQQQDSAKQQQQQQLKTNFSKPENCLSPGTKQISAKQILSSPAIKSKKSMLGSNKADVVDKSCIYSVPNKGKYLRGGSAAVNPNADKMNGGPVNTGNAYSAKSTADQLDGGGSLDDDLAASSDPESNFPDDGCSEFTDVYFQNGHHGHHGHHGQQQQPGDHDPLRKQLRGIEDMYSELLNMLNSKQAESALFQHQRQPPRRTKLFRRNSGRSSVASRNTRDYISRRYRGAGGGGGDCRSRTKPDDLQLSRRYKKLESQVLTLAKSVSQLSADIQFNFMLNEEMESLRHEVEMLKSQMSNVKQNVASLSKSQQQVAAVNQHQQQQQQLCTTLNRATAAAKEPKKVDKLKRLFVDEPQPMKLFLKKLGYEKYCKHFEAEKIGLAELVHLNEERLQKLGLPMGPRLRLLQEAKNLAAMMNGTGCGKAVPSGATGRDIGGGNGGGKQSAPAGNGVQDTFNIYAVV